MTNKKLSNSVGKTPLLPIINNINNHCVWGKAEFMNPGGSVKDRMATYILNDAEKRGLIKKGDTLVEATSGNTGISFSMLAAERGYKMTIVMPSNMSIERKKIFGFYGADLIEVSAGDFDTAIEIRNNICKETPNHFNCNQFHNPLNIEAHYKNTAPEIYNEYINNINTIPDILCLGTGTGGTLMGIGKYLKEKWPTIKIIAVEPLESPVMSGGSHGLHGIQGIGDGSKFLVDLDFVDEVVTVSTEDAMERARILSKNGLFVGISTGANVLASERWLEKNIEPGVSGNAITILCDRGERYFSCL